MLELYNTMSGTKESFKPIEDNSVKMFTCGPSIYRRPHVGNYRTFLWEDALLRYLEYLGYRVERVINLTDVEDKAISEAESEGMGIAELTGKVADYFFSDAGRLRIKLPALIPRSSTTVDEAARILKILLEKGVAYRHEGNIFFDPLKFKDFGKLFRLDMSRWPKEKRRFKKDTYPGRRWNLGDFILWHGCKEGDDVFWDTEIGKGRPAWNIQDPAIIVKHLGCRLDIACGGIDNIYRHHDYNIAVVEAAFGPELARYWLHAEHLLSDGKKMSKSKGNIVYPDDLFEKGYSPQHVRFYLLYGHHRRTLNLTEESLKEKTGILDAFREKVNQLLEAGSGTQRSATSGGAADKLIESLSAGFRKHMDDDLRVKRAFDAMDEALSSLLALKEDGRITAGDRERIELELRKIDEVLQVIFV